MNKDKLTYAERAKLILQKSPNHLFDKYIDWIQEIAERTIRLDYIYDFDCSDYIFIFKDFSSLKYSEGEYITFK
jgi:hypothetical protein